MSKKQLAIPEGSVEVQIGLWAYERKFYNFITQQYQTTFELYASEGYCFYCIPDNLDENGNLRPENERIYAQYRTGAHDAKTLEEINDYFVSVPIKQGYEM